MGDEHDKKKIFLIDDDTIFHDMVVSILSDKYNVETSKSGHDALIQLVKYSPDLILLDIVMPDMDGWTTFHKIRGISLLQRVPVAFITSLSESEGLEQARRLGASDYFTKPIDAMNFLSRIEKILY